MSSATPNIAFNAIPAELKERPQWVLWKYVDRDGKPNKEPFQVNGELAASDEPATWTDFETVVERYAIAEGRFDGIGFVFSASDPYCGVDLDGCLNPATGETAEWAHYWITELNSYTEVSPSGTGYKVFCRGNNTKGTGGNRKLDDEPMISDKKPGVEIYDQLRYFTITGWHVEGTSHDIQPAQEAIDEFVGKYFSRAKSMGTTAPNRLDLVERCWKYCTKIPEAISGDNGHDKTFRAACECFRFGLTDSEAQEVMRRFNASRTGGDKWTEKELQHKLDDARERVTLDGEFGSRLREDPSRSNEPRFRTDDWKTPTEESTRETQHHNNGHAHQQSSQKAPKRMPQPISIGQLVVDHPHLASPAIEGVIRHSETGNFISAPKVGKSWSTHGLAVCKAKGLPWLDTFECEPGRVLLIDNELAPSVIANRLPKVAEAMQVEWSSIKDLIDVVPLRGANVDLHGLVRLIETIEPGRYSLVICDAWYRILPMGTNENDNAQIMSLYNRLDEYTEHLKSAWLNVHHTSRGMQGDKAVTDVGAGAGSQSRAADTHLVLRPHEDEGVFVLEAAVRSFPPVAPVCIRWEFPLWLPADNADPRRLKRPATKRDVRQQEKDEDGFHKIIAALFTHQRGTARQLREWTGISRERLERLLAWPHASRWSTRPKGDSPQGEPLR